MIGEANYIAIEFYLTIIFLVIEKKEEMRVGWCEESVGCWGWKVRVVCDLIESVGWLQKVRAERQWLSGVLRGGAWTHQRWSNYQVGLL